MKEYHGDERQGGEIRARAGMDVYDINTGGWKKSKATNTDVLPFFDEKGSHFWTNIFGNSAIMAQTYFDKGIDNAISRIDFSNYLIVK